MVAFRSFGISGLGLWAAVRRLQYISSFECSNCLVVMPRGEKISPELQWVILRLSKLLMTEQIAMCVGVSERSIRRIISHFREHGTIEAAQSVQEEHKFNGHLRDIDVEVRISL